jgi:hypothetical protein
LLPFGESVIGRTCPLSNATKEVCATAGVATTVAVRKTTNKAAVKERGDSKTPFNNTDTP